MNDRREMNGQAKTLAQSREKKIIGFSYEAASAVACAKLEGIFHQ